MRKLFVSLFTFILTIFIYMNVVNASGFEMNIESDNNIIKSGETIVLTVSINNIETDNEGIDLLLASISYDNNVFENVEENDIKALGQWGGLLFNPNNNKLIIERNSQTKSNEEVFQISLKAKDNIDVESTKISINQAQSTDGNQDIEGLDGNIELKTQKYYNKLNIIGYESNPVKYYVEGEQEFGVTLMLEQSCTILTKSIEETIKVIINNIKYN